MASQGEAIHQWIMWMTGMNPTWITHFESLLKQQLVKKGFRAAEDYRLHKYFLH